MNKSREDDFREILKHERTRLTSEIGRSQVVFGNHERLGYGNHMADDATEVFEQAKDLALLQHMEYLLEEINDALEKMERGQYGLCEGCEQMMDVERLQVIPYARLCVECQKKVK